MGEFNVWIVFPTVAIRICGSSPLVQLDSCLTAATAFLHHPTWPNYTYYKSPLSTRSCARLKPTVLKHATCRYLWNHAYSQLSNTETLKFQTSKSCFQLTILLIIIKFQHCPIKNEKKNHVNSISSYKSGIHSAC